MTQWTSEQEGKRARGQEGKREPKNELKDLNHA